MSFETKHPDLTLIEMRTTVTDRLNKVRGRMRRQLMLEGIARVLLLAVGLLVFTFVFDWKFELSRSARVVLIGASCACFAYLLVRYVLIPAFAKWEAMDIAGAIDNNGFTSVDQAISPKVASLFQMAEDARSEQEYSSDLADEAAKQNFEALKKIDFENRLNQLHRRNSWIGVLAGVLVPLLLLLVVPSSLSETWYGRWLRLIDVPWPRNTQIEIIGLSDGKLVVPRGEPTDLVVEVSGKKALPDRIRLEVRYQDRKPKRMTIVRDSNGKFKQELAGLNAAASLKVWAGDAKQGPVDISPVDRPKLVDVRLKHQHPWDEKPQVHDFDRGDGAISLLPKTGAELILKSNVNVKELQAEWNMSEPPKMERVGEQEFLARWEHDNDAQLRVQLVGTESGLLSAHRLVSIGLKRDRPPSITVRPNGVRRRVTPTATIPLQITARDDFGISILNLSSLAEKAKSIELATSEEVEKPDDEVKPEEVVKPQNQPTAVSKELALLGPVDPASERLIDLEHRYALSSESLEPGDMIRMKATATDACFTGQQSTESPWMTFSIVKPQELFREILIRQQQLRSRLRKATDQATDLRDSITTAQFPGDGRPLIREHRMIQRDVATAHRGLADTVREMELNELGGPEAIELIIKNVLDPLQRMAEQDMNDQRSLLETLTRGGNASQSEAVDRQGKIVEDLKAVLKSMAQWDSFVDVVNQLDTVIKLQGKLKDTTEELRKKDVESVFDD